MLYLAIEIRNEKIVAQYYDDDDRFLGEVLELFCLEGRSVSEIAKLARDRLASWNRTSISLNKRANS